MNYNKLKQEWTIEENGFVCSTEHRFIIVCKKP